MKTLYNYILESRNISDDDIYYILGKHIYDVRRDNHSDSDNGYLSKEDIDKKYRITKSNFRSKIIKFAKDNLYPIEPKENELIPRYRWDLKGICGQSIDVLKHDHFNEIRSLIEKHHKKKHDVLLVLPCTNKKPYFTMQHYKFIINMFGDFCDIAYVSNPGLVPNEYCNHYPYRYYEWNDKYLDEETSKAYDELVPQYIKKYDGHFKYKHYVIAIPTQWERKVFDVIKKESGSLAEKLIFPWSDRFMNNIVNDPGCKMTRGLLATRAFNYFETIEKLYKTILGCVADKDGLKRVWKEYLKKSKK